MVVIVLNRKQLKISTIIFISFISLVIFCIHSFPVSTIIQTQGNNIIEIFDIRKGSVIESIHSSYLIQNEAEKYLKGITGMYVKVKAIPDKGYIVKIPLDPPIMLKNQWLNGLVTDVFIILPEPGIPYILVLDDEGRPLFYTFEANTDGLLKQLKFRPKGTQ